MCTRVGKRTNDSGSAARRLSLSSTLLTPRDQILNYNSLNGIVIRTKYTRRRNLSEFQYLEVV